MTATVTVGTFNAERCFYDFTTGRHDVDALVEVITAAPCDILGLPEATRCMDNGETGLKRIVNALSELLPHGEQTSLVSGERTSSSRGNMRTSLVAALVGVVVVLAARSVILWPDEPVARQAAAVF